MVQQQVQGILFRGTSVPTAAHPPRAARHDLLHEPLDTPPLLPKPHRERVKQRLCQRVGGRLSELPKIVGGGHESATKEMVPDAVDDHAGGQRVGWIEDPVRQFPAARRIPGPLRLARPVDRLQKPPWRDFAATGRGALQEHVLIDAIAVEDGRRRGRLELHVGEDCIPRCGLRDRLVHRPLRGGSVPIEPRIGKPTIDRRGKRRIAPLGLLDRRHRLGDRHGTLDRSIFHMNDPTALPREIFPQILTDPFPCPTRVGLRQMRAVDRPTLQQQVAVDHDEDLHMAADAVPDHTVLDQHLGRS